MAGAGGMMLSGIPVRAMAGNQVFQFLAASGNTDNVLVFIQLHGGNDALNTLIPVSQYDEYYNLRPHIAIDSTGTRSYIELDTTVDENKRAGLHPDMQAFKDMYDSGKVAIVHNVGYPEMNGSHFRGRDIVFMGTDGANADTDDYASGWMGRWLNHEYPGYPDDYPTETMEDPLGIELSGAQSLAFHRENGIPIGLSFNNPTAFYNLINSVGVEPPIEFPDSHAGDELRYLMEMERTSNKYAERLKNVYDAGSNSISYPDTYPYIAPAGSINNPLSSQLRLIARLLAGGIKTRIFLCRIGGFDTHGDQVEEGNTSYGHHAALLYHLSSAVKAFYDDMGNLGVANKVLSMTFTEFGRRAYSNLSLGTDHGSSTPVFVFGTNLNPGIYGTNPDLNNLSNGNLRFTTDYRSIYTSVVQDWFGSNDEAMNVTGFGEWIDDKLPLIATTNVPDFSAIRRDKLVVYPNPIQEAATVSFYFAEKSKYTLEVFSTDGRKIMAMEGKGELGVNQVNLNLNGTQAGNYLVKLKTGQKEWTQKVIKK
jgi:uncharacterized protein (DUF1501 family)